MKPRNPRSRRAILTAAGLCSLALVCTTAPAGAQSTQSLLDRARREAGQIRTDRDRIAAAFAEADAQQDVTEAKIGETEIQIDRVRSDIGQLQEQLKELPPEERGRMEGMLGRPPGAEITSPAAAYRKTAPGQRVGRWTCDRYELRVLGKKEGEACFARAATLGLGPEEARTLEAFFAFLGQLA